jgi:hypothetical protein
MIDDLDQRTLRLPSDPELVAVALGRLAGTDPAITVRVPFTDTVRCLLHGFERPGVHIHAHHFRVRL